MVRPGLGPVAARLAALQAVAAPAAGLRRSPRPRGIPGDPVAQWLFDAILSDLTLQQICDRGRQDEIDFPTAKGGGARHLLALGHEPPPP
ncbi:hypothetical protein Slala03_54110 [Streptomyces lavendulae subsp. lavendulae]|nr:hypothetical protein Slala03_54110 [Streptomyces lavendulae subsp. lavendulae]